MPADNRSLLDVAMILCMRGHPNTTWGRGKAPSPTAPSQRLVWWVWERVC
jgi:hypothetical protein